MKPFLLQLIFSGLLIPFSGFAQTLQAVLAADTQNPNSEFAESCQADLEIMRKELGEMAKGAGYSLNIRDVQGTDFTSAKLKAALSSVQVKPSDVFIFYFSGAGFCAESESDQDKNRSLRLGKNGMDIASTAELIPAIQAKGARLNLIIIDACALIREVAISSKRGEAERKVYRSLFSACGTIRAYSSRCTQYSYGDGNGGLFTNAFISAIDYFINRNYQQLTWKELLGEAQKITAQHVSAIFRNQNPVFFFDEHFSDKCTP